MIARIFPRKTKMTPNDTGCYVGLPHPYTPDYDEIHISVTFTWDIPQVEDLRKAWLKFGPVKVGGPAYGDPGGQFTPGMYLRQGITITSRGCPNKCNFCFVPEREGGIRELKVRCGNIIQDNNLLACSEDHISKVLEMLKFQKQIEFSGGFEAKYITNELCHRLRQLSIRHIFVSYDQPSEKDDVSRAISLLRDHFNIRQVRCYVLIGTKKDTLEKAENRLRWILNLGGLPFAMRFRTANSEWQDSYLHTDKGWNLLTREWSRPAIMLAK
jgi:hypothetical protein